MIEHRIRPARPDEFGRLVDIEAVADELFATAGIGPLPHSNPDALGAALHLIVIGDPAYGFARIDEVDGTAHLEQLSVHPDHARAGAGTALLEAACDWAAGKGYATITLSTFADVPWNAPFYARHGFEPMNDLGPGLRGLRATEKGIGLDRLGTRVVMCRVLGRRGP